MITLIFLLAFQDKLPSGVQSFQFAQIQVPVWVFDSKGRTVANLKPKDFTVMVDGVKVKAERFSKSYYKPLELVFLLDLSGSMGLGGKLEGSIAAIKQMVRHRKKGDTFKIVVFADQQVLQIANTNNAGELDEILEKAKAYGKTALFDALSQAQTFYSPLTAGNRALIVFTDGNDNQSILTEEQVIAILGVIDVPVFAVGILDGVWPTTEASEEALNVDTLRHISDATGGRLMLAKTSADLPRIAAMINQSMRAHYQLAFTVERGPGEKNHSILVKTRQKSYRVRSRRGYIGLNPENVGGKE